MRGRILILVSLFAVVFFLSFYNNNRIVKYTRTISALEKTYYADKNINTELLVEYDDLRSGRHIASLVRVDDNFIPSGSRKNNLCARALSQAGKEELLHHRPVG